MKVIFATFGSLGDLHPVMALSLELQKRGHKVVVATQKGYREKLEAAGIEFHHMGPDVFLEDSAVVEMVMDVKNGPESLIKDVISPAVAETYQQLLPACLDADLIVTTNVTFAAHLVAEKLNKRWVSTLLAPIGFWSSFDPSVPTPYPLVGLLRILGVTFNRALFNAAKASCKNWTLPVQAFRAVLGLPPTSKDPLFDGQFSPYGSLAMFSPVLGAPQPDWPENIFQSGFVFYDQHESKKELTPETKEFLAAGNPPVVFTLGSAAVHIPGEFFNTSILAARLLGCRAIFVVGVDQKNINADLLDRQKHLVLDYVPYSKLFPLAACVVHQGGAGTTGQVLHAGVPMLVVPFSHDQPDNAARVCRLGVARKLRRVAYSVENVRRNIRKLLSDKLYAQKAIQVAKLVKSENGLQRACDYLEAQV